jgi:STE24 endopeptidase
MIKPAAMVVAAVLLFAAAVRAQTPPLQIPPEAQASPSFDPVRATNAYLAAVPADKKARSDAYFEGGYWLQLWDFLYTAIAIEELIFFDHPSGRTRIFSAMRWKAENVKN